MKDKQRSTSQVEDKQRSTSQVEDKQRSTSQVEDKHTPGPWWYENETAQICANHPLDEQYIARIYDADSVHSEKLPQEANARLMAAAPEMKEDLEEAVRLLKHLRYLYDVEMCEDEAYINDFITKAESTLAKIEGN